ARKPSSRSTGHTSCSGKLWLSDVRSCSESLPSKNVTESPIGRRAIKRKNESATPGQLKKSHASAGVVDCQSHQLSNALLFVEQAIVTLNDSFEFTSALTSTHSTSSFSLTWRPRYKPSSSVQPGLAGSLIPSTSAESHAASARASVWPN